MLTRKKHEPMNPDDYSIEVMRLFQSKEKLTKNEGRYQMIAQYDNLSCHLFTEDEIDFLCECYHSGSHSLIGVTKLQGERRLTVNGITERYKISVEQVRKWLRDYKTKMKLIDETANIIYGKAPNMPCT